MIGVPRQALRVLVTGFEPFDGEALNPSWEVARSLADTAMPGVQLCAAQLPCTFAGSLPALQAAVARHRPQVVLALGLAGNRSAVSVERVAVNLVDARIADNAGERPLDLPVVRGGPAAYFSTLPVKAIAAALAGKGLPAEVSFTAGSFVCNQVFYGLMHSLRRRPTVRAGFIHLPPLPEQSTRHPGSRALPLALQVLALRCMVEVLLSPTEEPSTPVGQVS